ncbi:PREDICTED: 39S ribosomal protein L38, mitochondrial-like [Priapulus caudatus]|uniref:Large ribosomal subunit protein mL38 n=1 Tax=Priapulus caudatus TaxID=37621 RepID=A0ABM1F8M8_PRICU|nr:PREDICTED: 39S ribosomal protein L38, mitochondrial-like [Priapulus caudatus]
MVNIGLPLPKENKEKLKELKKAIIDGRRANHLLEQAARHRTLKVDIDQLENDMKGSAFSKHVRTSAEHYGVYKDLFGPHAYFNPAVALSIAFDYDDDAVSHVFNGNMLKPAECVSAPHIHYEAEKDTLWSIVLTAPDSHLADNKAEYLHWFVGNIEGSTIDTGELLCDFLQPLPLRGTGWHRYVFVLYKQERRIDFASEKRTQPCKSLKERTFHTYDFYKRYEDDITPAGIGFFQADWDSSVSDIFHKTLDMKEPVYEFDSPPLHIAIQRQVPHKQPFNLYLDRYRDPKDIAKEVLTKRFSDRSPFSGEPRRRQFPGIMPWSSLNDRDPLLPSWRKAQIQKERDGRQRYRHIYENRPGP